MSKQRISSFLNNPSFSSTLPFLQKYYFIPLPLAKLEEVNFPLYKGEGGGECSNNRCRHVNSPF